MNAGSKPQAISLPFDGSVYDVVTDPTEPGALIDVMSWTKPGDYYRFDPVTAASLPWAWNLRAPLTRRTLFRKSEGRRRRMTLDTAFDHLQERMKLDGSNPRIDWIRIARRCVEASVLAPLFRVD